VIEPTRIRAAVVAASLAGSADEVWGALSAADQALAGRVRERLRASGERRRVAEAIVAEHHAVTHPTVGHASPDGGARFYAAWMRSLDAPTRARVARGLDESDLARLRPHLRDGAALDDAHRSAATWMLAQGARVLRRVPAVSEASQLLSVLRGERDASSPAIVRWERALRISGRCEACAAMALSQVANQ
jgi:hypothetical protein